MDCLSGLELVPPSPTSNTDHPWLPLGSFFGIAGPSCSARQRLSQALDRRLPFPPSSQQYMQFLCVECPPLSPNLMSGVQLHPSLPQHSQAAS